MNNITKFHAKLFANQLDKRFPSDDMEKFSATLSEAQVDLNPHQIEAALFPFKSPFSKGAILADEVGLGKTIEAGIIISQIWAERKRNILIIVPASLRKQWQIELREKFFLPSIVLEADSFDKYLKKGKGNPFDLKKIIISSYRYCYNKEDYVTIIPWDLVVFDEAHRLRNVYKPDNKIATTLRSVLKNRKKILLTATPLQNTLLELYGLSTFIDKHIFGDKDSFKDQFSRLNNYSDEFSDLKQRINKFCIRTLREQVQEYVKYTNRKAITIKFTTNREENELYEKVSNYLRREHLYAVKNRAKHLIVLVLRKLLASSTYAIGATLKKMAARLEEKYLYAKNSINKEKYNNIEKQISKDFEEYDEIKEEWGIDEEDNNDKYAKQDLIEMKKEIEDLKSWANFAFSIKKNSKGERLIKGLEKGFKKLNEMGANEKAVIFTESKKTQKYLYDRLSKEEKYKNKIVIFNGSNKNKQAKKIYNNWIEINEGSEKVSGNSKVDKRQAIIDHFKNSAKIMIATEAAAEGINLQFCSLVINYDLPWNPQRIEQRIGRCHRYGQKYDVVVINFVNIANEADKRVYELLYEKFNLFEGVFGASDEILGAIGSGVDIEKRIVDIYQKCRTPEEIDKAFNLLQKDLEEVITEEMESTKKKLLENFDEEVHQKLKIKEKKSKEFINQYQKKLLDITKFYLGNNYKKDKSIDIGFIVNRNYKKLKRGRYKIGEIKDGYKNYRINHPFARKIINKYKSKSLNNSKLLFDLSNHQFKITALNKYKEEEGEILAVKYSIEGIDPQDYILLFNITSNGFQIDNELTKKFFNLKGKIIEKNIELDKIEILKKKKDKKIAEINNTLEEKNLKYFDDEYVKLDKWAEDKKKSLNLELKKFDDKLKEVKKKIRMSRNMEEKFKLIKKQKQIQKKKKIKEKELDKKKKKIDEKFDVLLDQMENKLKSKRNEKELFRIKWKLI